MSTSRRSMFSTIRTEGSILPSDLLQRISERDSDIDGLAPNDYHLAAGERPNEAINRSWNHLLGAWSAFRSAMAGLSDQDPAAGVTRDRWLLPLFSELGYGRLPPAKSIEINGRSYPISHLWHHSPVHLVGCGVDLDRRTKGVPGAARGSPHSLVQEFLNNSDSHLWGFVSNGFLLRILRDNASLTRQAYTEFDLRAMMEGEVYSDFVLLWLLCHQSRVEADKPEECWLERWSRLARNQGARALDRLQAGVKTAIEKLGEGFLAYPSNSALRDRLKSGSLTTQDFYRQLLRLVYRLLFLFVAEERDALFSPQADPPARDRYSRFYSAARLRKLAGKRFGTRHPDLFRGLCLVMGKLGSDAGCPELGLPALGSYLWSAEAISDLFGCDMANLKLLEAVRALAFTTADKTRRAVDYKNLGSEELGGVYESLLQFHPKINIDTAEVRLDTAPGHERKKTGSYYTPSSLIACLLDSALDPVVQAAAGGRNPENAILSLKVCDPACGSGHFLVAAAHRIAKRLAAIRTGDEEPAPEPTRTALRDVIGRCIYGVDLNPMAVELCKVSLWMEALDPGRPLSFLDHHIVGGNSLLGTTPALLTAGLPDEAFQALEGDEKAKVTALRKKNKTERGGQSSFYLQLVAEGPVPYGEVEEQVLDLERIGDASIASVHEKEERYGRILQSDAYRRARLEADAHCAAFVWPRAGGAPGALTQGILAELQKDPASVPRPALREIERLAEQYQFLHWHIAFPGVFQIPQVGMPAENPQAGWNGGFDVVLGNPPWERIKLQEKEWFAATRPDIAEAPNAAARRKMITALENDDPLLFDAFKQALRFAEGESHLIRKSGRYPLCGRGDINTYAIFAESNRLIVGSRGRVGCIVQSDIATGDTYKDFFADLLASKCLVSLYDFVNTERLFPDVDTRNPHFCLLTVKGADQAKGEADFAFWNTNALDLKDDERHFTLTVEDLALLNPNTRTCPIFRSRRDAELTKAIYRRVPVLIKEGPPEENPWGISFMRMFDMANDSHLFRTRGQLEGSGWTLEGNTFVRSELRGRRKRANPPHEVESKGGFDTALAKPDPRQSGLTQAGPVPESSSAVLRDDSEVVRWLPLYEAKMIHHFDHRWATYEGTDPRELTLEEKSNPQFLALPRYWVTEAEVNSRLAGRWDHDWLLGWRDITNTTNERTIIASVLPRVGVGHTCPLLIAGTGSPSYLCSLVHCNT